MRHGFAIAANLDPDILLLDEIFAVGDADFQQRCVATVKRFMDEGKTIIFVSHAPSSIRAICRRVCVLEQGELVFDGDVAAGLAFYEELLARRAAAGDGVAAAWAQPPIVEADEAELDRAPHRVALGGMWRETGLWWFEFFRQQGLEPRHHVLVGCGSLVAAAVRFLPFLEDSHYWGVERNRALLDAGLQIELPRAGIAPDRGRFLITDTFDLNGIPGPFDFALANSVFVQSPFNDVAHCIASVVSRLEPSGRFYASWFENPDPASYDAIVHPNGVTTYPDRAPYHYPFALIAHVCAAVGAIVDRVDNWTNPRGESILAISRRHA
jgi:SAM-dependent methyltransferase